MAETFRRAVVHDGTEIQAIAYTLTVQKTNIAATACSYSYSLGAYTLTVQKTNISATHSAMITMSAPVEWVTAHGGISSIVIGRIADDQTCTILETSFSGYDRNGNMEFVAASPDGLSVFGLIATRKSLRSPAISPIPGILNSTIGGLGAVILIILIVVLITGCIIWRRRRTRPEKPSQHDTK
jgi:hypothetical protein